MKHRTALARLTLTFMFVVRATEVPHSQHNFLKAERLAESGFRCNVAVSHVPYETSRACTRIGGPVLCVLIRGISRTRLHIYFYASTVVAVVKLFWDCDAVHWKLMMRKEKYNCSKLSSLFNNQLINTK